MGVGKSTASQTAWALLGLMAVGEVGSPNVQTGINYLIRNQNSDGEWDEDLYTGTGFPRVFYLKYHGYRRFFPLMALTNYQNLTERGSTLQQAIIRAGKVDLGPLPILGAAVS